MGVQGSGKSTVGRAVAERLGIEFRDGDDLHPAANTAKMARGEPLNDRDRAPWLHRIGVEIADAEVAGRRLVLACSALKRRYRDQLREHVPALAFVYLDGDRELLERRLAGRSHEFMPNDLLGSQLATLEPLEPDERGVAVSIDASLGAVVDEIVRALGEAGLGCFAHRDSTTSS